MSAAPIIAPTRYRDGSCSRPPVHRFFLRLHVFLLLGWCVGGVLTVQAQLISPGKLSRAHQDLEGVRNCTACHTLGQQGVDAALCLGCHEPLKTRLAAKKGFHAALADQPCADCHKEHFGIAFDVVRFDTTGFDHAQTGYRLTGAHTEAACRNCHRPERIAAADVRAFKGRHNALDRTFLGLSDRCLSCHEPDTPHAGQFAGEDCATCHATDRWEEASRFDHDTARFKLTGRHREAACQDCHRQEAAPDGDGFTRYEGLSFAACASCHQDAHNGAFGVDCAGCHNPDGWGQIRNFAEDRFDHAATGFSLVGRHARLDCAACHARPARRDAAIQMVFVRGAEGRTYPKIQVADCLSCHTDYHRETFAETPGGIVCENCHTQEGWTPTTYDLERHAREARFPLTGAHLATPCVACHHAPAGAPVFRFADLACQACHAPDNPHGDQFDDATGATACADCHTTDGWLLDAAFDHTRTGFSLTGRHAEAACADCHRAGLEEPAPYRGLATDCLSCHAADDPHRGQFAQQTCDTCHDADAFRTASARFDHSRARFPLEGAHRDVACGQCHREESAPDGGLFVRYRPMSFACKDCHRDG